MRSSRVAAEVGVELLDAGEPDGGGGPEGGGADAGWLGDVIPKGFPKAGSFA
jgi:hypothetical protein